MGAMLFDIGKLGLDPELLETSRQLTEQEFQQVRGHVKLGLEMIQKRQDHGCIEILQCER